MATLHVVRLPDRGGPVFWGLTVVGDQLWKGHFPGSNPTDALESAISKASSCIAKEEKGHPCDPSVFAFLNTHPESSTTQSFDMNAPAASDGNLPVVDGGLSQSDRESAWVGLQLGSFHMKSTCFSIVIQ